MSARIKGIEELVAGRAAPPFQRRKQARLNLIRVEAGVIVLAVGQADLPVRAIVKGTLQPLRRCSATRR